MSAYGPAVFAARTDGAEIAEDEDAGWKEIGAKIGAEIERAHPGRYRFTCYAVED